MKANLSSIWVILLLVAYQTLSGQQLQSTLLDNETKEPIFNALVYVANSSIAATTDDDGRFKIVIPKNVKGELVITHLNYQTESIDLSNDELPKVIMLNQKSNELQNVFVKSKKSKKRKGWLKQFDGAVFGKMKKRHKPVIQNPEVILFQEKEGILTAQLMDNLQIINKRLGYDIVLSLDTFSINQDGDGVYAGKALFKDVVPDSKKGKKIEKLRDKIYKSSRQHFYKSLINNTINPTFTELAIVQLDDALELVDYQEVEASDLTMQKGGNTAVLYMKDYLSVTDLQYVVEYANSFRGIEKKFSNSLIKSKSGKFIIDQYGNLLNPLDTEELGRWAGQRLGDLLPSDYVSDDSFVVAPKAVNNIIDTLEHFITTNRQEKIFIHHNKPYYSIGEKVWFKLYPVDAFDHSPNTISKVFYVDLIGPNGDIVSSSMLHADKDLSGAFQFGKTDSAGIYEIRAYSNHMRNYGQKHFYQSAIQVFDFSTDGGLEIGLVESYKDKFEKMQTYNESMDFRIGFYPEGGHMIENASSNIAFEAINSRGELIDVVGRIVTDSGVYITNFETSQPGYGIFNITPESDQKYWAETNVDGVTYHFSLPIAQQNGMSLTVNNTGDNKAYVNVVSSNKSDLEGSFIIGHLRGLPVLLLEDIFPDEPMTIYKDDLPAGLINLSLFNEKGQVAAERILFNDQNLAQDKIIFRPEYSHFRPRQRVNVVLSSTDSAIINSQDFSISVTDQFVVQNQTVMNDALNYFYVNSELDYAINNLDVTKSIENPQERYLLDQKLMTKSLLRHSWDEILHPTIETQSYSAETGYSIKGFTTKKGKKKKRIQAEVLLTGLANDFYYQKIETDPNGNFEFSNLPYLDSVSYLLQGSELGSRKDKDPESLVMDGKNKIDFHFVQTEPAAVKRKSYLAKESAEIDIKALQSFLSMRAAEAKNDSISYAAYELEIEEVTVKANRNLRYQYGNTFNMNRIDWIDKHVTAKSMLSTLKPRNQYQSGPGGMVFVTRNEIGLVIKIPVVLVLDGLLSNALRLYTLPKESINLLSINGPFIAVTTKKNSNWWTKDKNGKIHITHPGYNSQVNFESPVYTVEEIDGKPDLRTAIYWKPDLKFDDSGNVNLSFFAADTPTNYQIRLEGISEDGEPVMSEYGIEIRDE